MDNAICRLLGCAHPIILGAMSRVNNPELVAAVSEAGGFGLLVAKNCANADDLLGQIQLVRGLTDKPFGVNLAARDEDCQSYVPLLKGAGVHAVTTSAGPPEAIVPACAEAGLAALHVVGNVSGAVRAQAAGAAGVIAEGGESGGLQGGGAIGTMVLIPAVCDAVDIPVAAAGGIAERRGYRAALALGAQGVQVGTRFIAAAECRADEAWKQAVCRATVSDTELVGLQRIFIRAIAEPLAVELGGQKGLWPAGQDAGLISEVLSARQIIEDMVA